MEQPITFSDLIEHFGSRAAMARELGVSKSAVSEWKGVVPETRAWQIEVVTKGRFKASQVIAGRFVDSGKSNPSPRTEAR